MRITTALIAATSLLAVPYVVATEVDDDDDEDWSEFDTVPSPEEKEPVREDTTLAEAADADLTESERVMRMTLCIGLVRQKYAEDAEAMKTILESMAKLQEVTEEQAANAIHVNMLKNCYINFDMENDLKELADESKFSEIATRIVSPPTDEPEGTTSTLLQRQWELINTVLDKEEKNKTSEEKGNGDKTSGEKKTGGKKETGRMPKIEVIGSGMNGFQKFLYFISVFGAVFGSGYLVVKKMIGLEAEKQAKRNAKKDKKKD